MSNLQQHEDRIIAIERLLKLRPPANEPKTEVEEAEDRLAEAIKRAKEKAAA